LSFDLREDHILRICAQRVAMALFEPESKKRMDETE
jgi:hypothetical protein